MKYCSKCGKQLNDDDAFCSGCGQPTGANIGQAPYQGQPVNQAYAGNNANSYNADSSYNNQGSSIKEESMALAIVALICSFLLPGVGIILPIIGLFTYKKTEYRIWCIVAIVINIIDIIIGITVISFGYWSIDAVEYMLTNCAIPG